MVTHANAIPTTSFKSFGGRLVVVPPTHGIIRSVSVLPLNIFKNDSSFRRRKKMEWFLAPQLSTKMTHFFTFPYFPKVKKAAVYASINEPILYIYIYNVPLHRFHINLMLIFGSKIWIDMLTKCERTSTTRRTSHGWLVKKVIGRHESSRHYIHMNKINTENDGWIN